MIAMLLSLALLADDMADRRVAESISCTPESATLVPSTDDEGTTAPEIEIEPFAFSLEWMPMTDAYRRAGHSEAIIASMGDVSVFVVEGEADFFVRMISVSNREPVMWGVRRASDYNIGMRFSLVSHDYQTGATLTIYPDDAAFQLFVPQARLGEHEIRALVVRGSCNVDWLSGDR